MRYTSPNVAFLYILLTGLPSLQVNVMRAQDLNSHWGINAHVPLPVEMDKMVECGITWFRTDFYSPGDSHRVDIEAKARGIQVFATIHPLPPEKIPPKDSAEWKQLEDFVFLFVSRYKDNIKYWGIGNELNTEPTWTLDQYVEFVKRAYAATKRADSTCQVVAPGFFYGGQWQQQLAYVLDHALNYIDVIDHHYYLENIPTAAAVLQQVDATKQILDAHGAADKPFWITETGLPSNTWGEELQANFYAEMCDGVAVRPWIKKLFFYHLRDNPGETAWGIVRADLSPKLSFFAYQSAIAAYKKPLVVSRTTPANGAQQAPLNSVITVEFSRGVNQASVLNALSITPSFEYAPEWSVHTLSIIPTARLLPTTAYTIKVKATAVSVIGDSLDGNGNGRYEGSPADDFSFSFTTGTTGKAGVVLSSSPQQGAVGVKSSAIRLTFQLPMDKVSVESAFSVSPVLSGFFSWEKDKAASFYPFVSLRAGALYTVTVRSTARDRWGYALDGNENGVSDSADDYHLYFVADGKGYYAVQGKFPLDLPSNASDTVQVVLPDTIDVAQVAEGRIRIVAKALEDTSRLTVSVNGSVMTAVAAVSDSGIGYRLVEAKVAGSVLKQGVNAIVLMNRGDVPIKLWPMVLMLEYVTGVHRDLAAQAVPSEYRLEQNYPNPFNPATVVSFQLSASSEVSLKVYDVLGREVATLVDKRLNAGRYHVAFSASHFALPSGVYFYRLATSQFADTKKMVVTR